MELKKLSAVLLSSALSVTSLSGCGSKESTGSREKQETTNVTA